MPSVPLPAVPADVLGCIARAALFAEGSTVEARRDLSLVCRAWREALRGEQFLLLPGSFCDELMRLVRHVGSVVRMTGIWSASICLLTMQP